MKLHKFLRAKRRWNNWTQVNAARYVKVSRDTLIRWEQGKKIPRFDEMATIAHVYQMTPAELLDVLVESGRERAVRLGIIGGA